MDKHGMCLGNCAFIAAIQLFRGLGLGIQIDVWAWWLWGSEGQGSGLSFEVSDLGV